MPNNDNTNIDKYVKGFEDTSVGRVKWPMSVIRISGENTERIIELADVILNSWREYSDEACFVFAETDGEPHNTITPAARFANGKYDWSRWKTIKGS